MREMSATEAARNFSEVLDQAEHGETIVVTRSGQRVATISPTSRANGSAMRKVLHRWRENPPGDAAFAERVAQARQDTSGEDADPWHD